jgi:hypothetical protein
MKKGRERKRKTEFLESDDDDIAHFPPNPETPSAPVLTPLNRDDDADQGARI